METKTQDRIEKTILLIPLFVGFIWMAYVVIDAQMPEPGVKLAPSKLEGLVTALFVFIIIYSIVLIVIFYTRSKKPMGQAVAIEAPSPAVVAGKTAAPKLAAKPKAKKAAKKPAKKAGKKK